MTANSLKLADYWMGRDHSHAADLTPPIRAATGP